MKKNKILKSTYLSMILISGALFLLFLLDYNKTQQETFQNIAENTLSENISQQQFSIETLINTEFGLLQTLGNTIYLVERDDDLLMLLQNLTLTTHYDSLFWLNTDMIGVSNDGSDISVDHSATIESALKGQTVISDPFYSEENQAIYILSATPSYSREGEINGAVCGIYTPEALKSLLLTSFVEEGVAHIVNSKGQYIASTFLELQYSSDTTTDIASMLEGAIFEDGSLESIFNDIQSLQSGKLSFIINNERYETAYMPLKISDWNIIITVPFKDLTPSSYILQERTYFLYVVFTLLFVGALLLFLNHEVRSKKLLYNTAYYDSLTGLPNLTKFKIDAKQLIKKYPSDRFSCIVFDILNFKLINDSFGNKVGDLILNEIAKISSGYMNANKEDVVVGRLYSDVFVIFSKERATKDAYLVKDSLIGQSRNSASMFRNIKLDFYLGRYISEPSEDIEQILERAKIAHSHAKNSITNEFTDYDTTIVKELHLVNSILTEFDNALENHEFKLYIQPQFNAKTKKISGAEVLVRWIKNDTIKYMPNDFISVFEKSSDILRLDAYIREQAFALLKKWQDAEINIPSLSVNVSRFDLLRPDFINDLITLTQKYNVDSSKIHLEITETTYVKDHMHMIEVVKLLQSHGFCVEMDDFGSGYSSLNILKDLSLDVIKLDMKFLNDHANNENGEIIITSIIEMAQKLNLKVIAEGTETEQQVNYLCNIGCNDLQGYYFAKPMPIEEFEKKILNDEL
ncbi:MAG: bifunctional diguanylate cyclase/phosphodiesterase [Lachnospiraceae bacterium]